MNVPFPVREETPALAGAPRKLFVETTTRCNLRCRMCVKQTRDNGVAEGDLSPALFDALKPALPNAESLVLSGIGEPLLHPHLEGFIRTAKELMPAGSWVGSPRWSAGQHRGEPASPS